MTLFQNKRLATTTCDEARDYAVHNVLSSRDIVSRPGGHKLDHHQYEIDVKHRSNLTITAICPAVLRKCDCQK